MHLGKAVQKQSPDCRLHHAVDSSLSMQECCKQLYRQRVQQSRPVMNMNSEYDMNNDCMKYLVFADELSTSTDF